MKRERERVARVPPVALAVPLAVLLVALPHQPANMAHMSHLIGQVIAHDNDFDRCLLSCNLGMDLRIALQTNPICNLAWTEKVQRFQGGLVFKAHRLCVALNFRLESRTEEEKENNLRKLFLLEKNDLVFRLSNSWVRVFEGFGERFGVYGLRCRVWT